MSIATSIGDAWRPRTNAWCSSSLPRRATRARAPGLAVEGTDEQDGEDRVLGHVRALAKDQVPGPEAGQRLGIEDSAKMTAAQSTTGSQGVSARESVTPTMLDSRSHKASGRGTPVQVRDGPAAVRGDAPAPRRHWPAGREGGTGGRPESEDPPSRRHSNPSRKGGFGDTQDPGRRRDGARGRTLGAAVRVHVRIEGKTQTLFGTTAPNVNVNANALDALEAASAAGELYYHVTTTSFGPYVDQIGRYGAAGQTGWVFKVNGKSPPVGADAGEALRRRHRALVLGPVRRRGRAEDARARAGGTQKNCYRVFAEDDNGTRTAAVGAVLHVGAHRTVPTQGATQAAVGCVGAHTGLVRATLAGAVRSNALA